MVNSLVWTAEEAKYLKALLRWQDTPADDEKRRRQAQDEAAERRRRQQLLQKEKPAGEFRVLVVGARGTGKTAILTRFAQNAFRGEGEPPDPLYERGCRHPITLETGASVTTTTTTTSGNTTITTTAPRPQTYIVDALEMPSRQLLSNPMLEQAVNITEAAVLVYNVHDPPSLKLAQGVADFLNEYLSPPPVNTGGGGGGGNPNPLPNRPYALLLVGNKTDIRDRPAPPVLSPLTNHPNLSSSTLSSSSSSSLSLSSTSPSTRPSNPRPSTASASVTPRRLPKRERQEDRVVSTAQGAMAASQMKSPGGGPVLFLEVSAKTGEGVDQIFPVLGLEILRMKRAVAQRREAAERMVTEKRMAGVTNGGAGVSGGVGSGSGGQGKKRGGVWRRVFRRGERAY